MKHSHRLLYWVSTACCLALAGCSGGSQPAPLVATPQQVDAVSLLQHPALRPGTNARHGWANSVFVSERFGNEVLQFADAANGAVLGTITDTTGPTGLDIDASGNLYVAALGDPSSIRIYAPGTYTAAKTLNDPGEYIIAVAACPNGTIYAANQFNTNSGNGDIAIYAPGATSPTGTVPDANIDSALSVACDKNDVLWYVYVAPSDTLSVGSYDGTTVTEYGNLGLGGFNQSSAIRAWVTSGLAIGSLTSGINLFRDPPTKRGTGKPLNCRDFGGTAFAFDKPDEHIYELGGDSVEKCDRSGKSVYSIGQGQLQNLELGGDVYTYPPGNT